MRRFLALAGVVLMLALPGCGGPFHRDLVTAPKPAGLVVIDDVTSAGHLRLSDGRTVRLFGLRTPADATGRAAFLAALRREVGGEADVVVALPTEPPAVDLRVWQPPVLRCGNALQTWNPFARPLRLHTSFTPVGHNLAIRFEDALFEADLGHREAPPASVDALRQAHAYGIEHRARRGG